jgi:TonB family protein
MPDPEHMVRPKYPKKSLKAGIEGHVELPVLVGNNGKTLEVTVGKGEPVFATPALEAIRKWQFHPVLIGGKPVETVYKIQVRFVLILQKAVTDWEIESPQETAEVASSASTDPKCDTPNQSIVCRRSEG